MYHPVNFSLVPLMPFKETLICACSKCGQSVRYRVGYEEDIVAKEQCSCLADGLVGSGVRLSEKETINVLKICIKTDSTVVLAKNLRNGNHFRWSGFSRTDATAPTYTKVILHLDNSVQNHESVSCRFPPPRGTLTAARFYCLLVTAACHQLTACDCSTPQLLGVVELGHFGA